MKDFISTCAFLNEQNKRKELERIFNSDTDKLDIALNRLTNATIKCEAKIKKLQILIDGYQELIKETKLERSILKKDHAPILPEYFPDPAKLEDCQ